MATEKSEKSEKLFVCEPCDFKCSSNCDWARHIMRPKHTNKVNGNTLATKTAKTHVCDCGKSYSDRTGLWKHKQKCNDVTNIHSLANLVIEVVKSNNELQKQNQEFKDLLVVQNKSIIETIKHGSITNNNNISTVNSNNKTFNLQVFLNEDCKDAMNVSDFMNSLNLQVSDLECVGQLGFVEGISNIIIKRLNAMDITKRPVHCTDSKRETIYIKEDGVWTKDDDDNMKIRKLVRGVSSRNCKNATAYKAMYPEWKDPESKHSYIYDKIVLEAFGGTNNGKDEENENKIIRKILKHLTIDKSAFIQ